MSSIDRDTLNRIIGNSQEREVESQRQFDRTVSRLTGHNPDMIDRYHTTPQPGNGPGTYQPKATATGKDLVSLYIPETAFRTGDWQDFQRARDAAINWLRSHRYEVVNGGALCWGTAFSLAEEPISYRDADGKGWFSCSLTTERDFRLACIKSRG